MPVHPYFLCIHPFVAGPYGRPPEARLNQGSGLGARVCSGQIIREGDVYVENRGVHASIAYIRSTHGALHRKNLPRREYLR